MAVTRINRTAGELIGLFTQTPLVLDFNLMGRTIRFETNNPTIFEYAKQLAKERKPDDTTESEFVWRVVSDPECWSATTTT